MRPWTSRRSRTRGPLLSSRSAALLAAAVVPSQSSAIAPCDDLDCRKFPANACQPQDGSYCHDYSVRIFEHNRLVSIWRGDLPVIRATLELADVVVYRVECGA